MLTLEDVHVSYGQLPAVRGVSLEVPSGGVLAVIGANGAGKSTLLKAIAGQLPLRSGRILLDGADISGLPAHVRVRRGVALVPEGRRLFKSLTVEENLLTALASRRTGPWDLEAVYELLPIVAERRDRIAGDLSGGEAQATAIARALVTNPLVLLLDEVSLGLAPVVVGQIYAGLPAIRSQGTAVLLVEQDVRQATSASPDVHCLLQGRTSLAGRDLPLDEITDAYFGA
ncbi:ABC transporter ATP-binding protein [Microbacterium gorillae]|uniref:ABC transporter ATP-binding protein n=1 Tax=Microbacterium gorillae TaxID=1231063 RepID=UPI0005912889|nr:ABC transporter ATP-binding protein [Microbacterium gorillae]